MKRTQRRRAGGQDGRESQGGREKRGEDLKAGTCSEFWACVIRQVEVKNSVQPQINKGGPMLTRAWLTHGWGQSQK